MFYFTSTIIYITAYNALKMCDIHYLRITKLLYKGCVDDFALGAEQFVVVCMLKKNRLSTIYVSKCCICTCIGVSHVLFI